MFVFFQLLRNDNIILDISSDMINISLLKIGYLVLSHTFRQQNKWMQTDNGLTLCYKYYELIFCGRIFPYSYILGKRGLQVLMLISQYDKRYVPLMWNVTLPLEYPFTHFNVLGQTRSENPSPTFYTYIHTSEHSILWCYYGGSQLEAR